MPRFTSLSLRSKLVLIMVVSSLVALSAAYFAYLMFDRVESRAEVVRQIDSLAEIVGSNTKAALVFGDEKAGEDTLATLRVNPGVVAARIFTASGGTFATYRSAKGEQAELPLRPEASGSRVEGSSVLVFHSIALRGERIGTVCLRFDMEELRHRQVIYAVVLFLIMLGGAGAAALAASRMQSIVSRPILSLAAAAKRVGETNDFSLRVPPPSPDEIGDLTRAFNDMLAEVEARDRALRAAQATLQNQVVELEQEVADRKEAQEALRRSEGQLVHAQKMEAVGTLAGGVAHDFNNLLQAMLNQLELLRAQVGDTAGGGAAVRELEQQVLHGASLTRQLLLFSRRETSKTETLDLTEVVGSATELMRRLLRANIALKLDFADGPLFVELDRGQLTQVVMNLTVNAADAMPDGGELTLRTGRDGSHRVWLEVQDTGCGIPAEIRERIFEPFFTSKGTGKGTGLGLSVVHGIVSRHRGRITVESQVGVGSTFRITLPAAGGEGSRDSARTPSGDQPVLVGRGERVLVVEDEAGARNGLQGILATLGFDVTAVASAEEAGQLPVKPGFQVLISDLMLPGASGAELAPAMLERWPGLKVIMMSGYAEDEVVRSGISAGGVRFLQKPFGMATLARELGSVLGRDPES